MLAPHLINFLLPLPLLCGVMSTPTSPVSPTARACFKCAAYVAGGGLMVGGLVTAAWLTGALGRLLLLYPNIWQVIPTMVIVSSLCTVASLVLLVRGLTLRIKK